MTEDQHQRRALARKALHNRAQRSHDLGTSVLAFEDKAMRDSSLIKAYDGNRRELERDVDAMARYVWGI